MKPISIESVCRHVYDRRFADIQRLKSFGATAMPYSREDFSKDVLADGFILSSSTVKTKWKALEATGLVKRGSLKTVLDIRMLEDMAEESE